MREYAILLVGFVVIEASFHKLEALGERNKERLAKMRHLSQVAWLVHPAAFNAGAEFCCKLVEEGVKHLMG